MGYVCVTLTPRLVAVAVPVSVWADAMIGAARVTPVAAIAASSARLCKVTSPVLSPKIRHATRSCHQIVVRGQRESTATLFVLAAITPAKVPRRRPPRASVHRNPLRPREASFHRGVSLTSWHRNRCPHVFELSACFFQQAGLMGGVHGFRLGSPASAT